eukprot:TRINITY_DN27121_c0_g1_i1.p2 TRINITY_DN27121_c0_g1~~TRINITY_DN27121_c0_g1_i1.p2  ORF type:complete len:133 (-),score=7.96 TRINITY_DN27121_c0_g1_i1:247-645(-)
MQEGENITNNAKSESQIIEPNIITKGMEVFQKQLQNIENQINQLELGFCEYQVQEKQRFDELTKWLRTSMAENREAFERSCFEVSQVKEQQNINLSRLMDSQQRFHSLIRQYQAQMGNLYNQDQDDQYYDRR